MQKLYIEDLETFELPKGLEYVRKYMAYVKAKIKIGKKYEIVKIPYLDRRIRFSYLKDKKEYSVLPILPSYAVSKDGIMLDLKTYTYLTSFKLGEYKAYPVKNENKVFPLLMHRLVAFAWKDNDDFIKNFIVDHIDNDKFNNHADNLRWVSMSENNSLAYRIHNDKDVTNTRPYVVYNATRNEIVRTFPSMTTAAKFMGRDPATISEQGFPFFMNKDGEFWILVNKEMLPTIERNPIVFKPNKGVVYVEDGLYRYKESMSEFLEAFPGVSRYWDNRAINSFIREKFNTEVLVLFRKNINKAKMFTIKNIKTGKIVYIEGIKPLARFVGIPESTLARIVKSGIQCYDLNGWTFDIYTKCKQYIKRSNKKQITVEFRDGTSRTFKSIREAERELKISARTLSKILEGKHMKHDTIASINVCHT